MFLYTSLRTAILPLKQIDHALPQKGEIIDLGCGQGVLATYLASKSTREVTGVDTNTARIPKSKLKNLKFINDDIRSYNLSGAKGIVLSDVLHHLKREDQKILLRRIAKGLSKGGVLIIKEIDTGEAIRSKLSRFWDFIFYPGEKIEFSNANDLKKFLQEIGFSIVLDRPCRFFPGSTTLFICTKK